MTGIDKTAEAAIRNSVMDTVNKRPARVPQRIAALVANIARLDAKEKGKALSKQAKKNRAQNKAELAMMRAFAAAVNVDTGEAAETGGEG